MNGILNIVGRNGEDHAKDNPTLVFLHYFGGSSRSWSEVIVLLAGEYRCVAPDLRGFGDSAALKGNYALSDYADDISTLIAGLDIKSCALIGHSMGGKIALAIAARRPANLHSLVLLAPSPPTPEPIPEEERARLLAGYGDRTAAEETLRKITARPLPAPTFERSIEDNMRCTRPAWRAWLETGSREDISTDVARIEVPVLVVAGAADEPLTTDLLQREVVQCINGARLITLPGVAHLLPLENPAAVAELIHQHCQFCVGGNKTTLKRH